MRLAVLGSTGATGRELVRQALSDGHDVTAIARNPADIEQRNPRLRVLAGDVAKPASISQGIHGADAVLSALGSSAGRSETTVYSAGVAAILSAMDERKCARRLIAISAAPVAPAHEKGPFERAILHPIISQFFGGLYDDMRRMEDLLRASDVDWTIFRPPRLTDAPLSGHPRLAVDARLPRAFSIGRADLAAAILASINDPLLVRHAVQIAK